MDAFDTVWPETKEVTAEKTERRTQSIFGGVRAYEFLTRNNFEPAKRSKIERKARKSGMLMTEQSQERINKQQFRSSTKIERRKSIVRADMFLREQAETKKRIGIMNNRPTVLPHVIHTLTPIKKPKQLKLSIEGTSPKCTDIVRTTNKKYMSLRAREREEAKKEQKSKLKFQVVDMENPEADKKKFQYLKKGENMRHFMAICFIKDQEKGRIAFENQEQPTINDRNRLHRLLGLFNGPINGIKVGCDLLQKPCLLVDQSRMSTQKRGNSAYSRARKRTTEGASANPSSEIKKICAWNTSDQN